MKSEFLAHAAHELRTPLTTILGYSEILLAMEVDAETRREALDAIHRQTLWLVDIINELLDLSRIEERRARISGSNASMSAACSASCCRALASTPSAGRSPWT
jgi:signal transduction histidine kinase